MPRRSPSMNTRESQQARVNSYLLLGLSLVLACSYSPSLVQADSPITPSGLDTEISAPPPLATGQTQYDITGGTRPGGGVNLFHSFGDFNVPTNNIANFLNDSGLPTSNILGRVTGGNISNIFGTIQTTGFGNANLFLMNPAGFIFGPDANINVGGMVAFTSADYLRLANGAVFNAIPNPNADALLSTTPVAAFGFLGSNPGAITVQGSQFTVTEGTDISLIGGNINIGSSFETGQGASIRAPGGQINLVSVASPGEVFVPNLQTEFLSTMGAVTLMGGATLDVSGSGSGRVFIRGGQLMMDNATILASTLGDIDGASSAVDIQVSQGVALTNFSSIIAYTSGIGRAGDVQLTVETLTMDNFSSIFTGSFDGGGVGGDVVLNVRAASLINGSSVLSQAQDFNFGFGQGGNVIIQGRQGAGSMADSVVLSGFGSGIISDSTGITTRAGDVAVHAKLLVVADGAVIQSRAIGTTAAGGNVTIDADRIDLSGLSGISSQAGDSDAGQITITARTLTLDNGSIVTNTFSQGGAGDVVVNAGRVDLSNGGLIKSSTSGSGRGGDIYITAGRLTLENASGINTETAFGDGMGGDLFLHVGALTLRGGAFGGSLIQSTNFNVGTDVDGDGIANVTGVGGAVTVNAADSVLLSGGSRIASSTNGSGQGGTITIQAKQVLFDGPGTGISFDTQQPFADMTVTINILHPNHGDLVVELDGPSGKHVALLKDVGGDGDNFTNTQFNDRAARQITSGAETFTGTFKPLEPLGRFINQPAAGGWTLTVRDQATDNVGSLQSWKIQLGGQIFQSVVGEPIPIPDNGSVQSTIIVAAPAVSTVPAVGQSTGTGGDVTIMANTVTVQNGATLSATTRGDGMGGTLIMNATGPVVLSGPGSGLFSESTADGAGGNIEVQASRMTMTNGSKVSASSTGPGDAGHIQINAGNQFAMTNSTVTTEAIQSSGGAIKITTTPNGMVHLDNSIISASVRDGTGGGGSVNIDPQFVLMQNNSQILANAVFGPGGNISITTNLLLPDATSLFSASSQSGVNGTVTIQSLNAPVSGQIQPLGKTPLLAATLLNQHCASVADGHFSSFTVAGRGSLPAELSSWLPSPLEVVTTGLVGGTASEPVIHASLSKGTKETPLLSLRRIAPAGFLTQTFAVDRSGCAT